MGRKNSPVGSGNSRKVQGGKQAGRGKAACGGEAEKNPEGPDGR